MSTAGADMDRRGSPSSPWLPASATVTHVVRELADTVTFGLRTVADPRPAPRPGQFNMLWVYGVGEVPISVAGLGDGELPVLHTVRAVGAVTDRLCELEAGDQIGLRGPFGSSWSIRTGTASARVADSSHLDLVVVAGGLGLAPLRPVIELAAARQDGFRRVSVLVGARSPSQLLYSAGIDRWRSEGLDVRVIVDTADSSWKGPIGVVTRLLPDAVTEPDHTFAMICGPEVMMRLVTAELVGFGVPANRIEVSLERNMVCGTGICGHCQLRELIVCRDGPVVRLDQVESLLRVPEL